MRGQAPERRVPILSAGVGRGHNAAADRPSLLNANAPVGAPSG
jgi:hypothetical protein